MPLAVKAVVVGGHRVVVAHRQPFDVPATGGGHGGGKGKCHCKNAHKSGNRLLVLGDLYFTQKDFKPLLLEQIC